MFGPLNRSSSQRPASVMPHPATPIISMLLWIVSATKEIPIIKCPLRYLPRLHTVSCGQFVAMETILVSLTLSHALKSNSFSFLRLGLMLISSLSVIGLFPGRINFSKLNDFSKKVGKGAKLEQMYSSSNFKFAEASLDAITSTSTCFNSDSLCNTISEGFVLYSAFEEMLRTS